VEARRLHSSDAPIPNLNSVVFEMSMDMTEPMSKAEFDRQIRRTWSERTFQEMVIQLAVFNGWLVYHTPDGEHMRKVNVTGKGFPDTEFVRNGRMVKAELKRVGKRPSKEQKTWLAEYAKVPCVESYWWTPEDWLTIEKVLV
jgi:hypothetical protein